MERKIFFGLVLVACFFALLLNIAFATDYADSIAKVTGYLFTLTVLPFLLSVIPTAAILFMAQTNKSKLSNKQRLWLFIWPCLLVLIIHVYLFYMLSFGGPL